MIVATPVFLMLPLTARTGIAQSAWRNYGDSFTACKRMGGRKRQRILSNPSSVPFSTQKQMPMILQGTSYLLPSLRLDRLATPTSIQNALESSTINSNPSLLLRKKGRWTAPLVLDFDAMRPDGSPHYRPPNVGTIQAMVQVLRDAGISVIGVANVPPSLEPEAHLGLPHLRQKGRALDKSPDSTPPIPMSDVLQLVRSSLHEEEQDKKENNTVTSSRMELTSTTTDSPQHPSQIPTPPCNAHIYVGSVRSGQQVSALPGQSLVVIGSVNSGGEVLSDADIFIFGKLRGRALAGLSGGAGCIICTSFDAELVAIGNSFTTVDSAHDLGLFVGGGAMVSLGKHGALEFKAIGN